MYSLFHNNVPIYRYLGTVEKFKQFCSKLETLKIARGRESDAVLVGFHEKEEALRALQLVQRDEEFPELEVAPACRI